MGCKEWLPGALTASLVVHLSACICTPIPAAATCARLTSGTLHKRLTGSGGMKFLKYSTLIVSVVPSRTVIWGLLGGAPPQPSAHQSTSVRPGDVIST